MRNRPTTATNPGRPSAYIACEPLLPTGTASFDVESGVVVIFSDTVPEVPDPNRLPNAHEAPLGSPLQENVIGLLEKFEIASAVVAFDPAVAILNVAGVAEIPGVAKGDG